MCYFCNGASPNAIYSYILKELNKDLTQKLESQTQRLELLTSQRMANENVLAKPIDTRSINDATMYADEGDEVSVCLQVPSGNLLVDPTANPWSFFIMCSHLDLYFTRNPTCVQAIVAVFLFILFE